MIRVYDQTLTQLGVIADYKCRFKRELRGAGSFEITVSNAAAQGLLQEDRIVALDDDTNGIIVDIDDSQDKKGNPIVAKGTGLLGILAYRIKQAT
jgi:hypothetical protein